MTFSVEKPVEHTWDASIFRACKQSPNKSLQVLDFALDERIVILETKSM